MPLEGGLEALTDNLRLHPIQDANTLSRLGLIMRRAAPRSALAEACFGLAPRVYLMVMAENAGAFEAYRGLGFWPAERFVFARFRLADR